MKYLKYLWYIIRHKWYVFIECCKLGIPIRGLLHDWHKLLPDEFFPYMEYFYGRRAKLPSIIKGLYGKPEYAKEFLVYNEILQQYDGWFNEAWLKHQHRSSHHWQHWVLREDSSEELITIEMPDNVVKEMVADWRGAGKAITGKDNTLEWYRRNMRLMLLHPKTRSRVEDLIGYTKAEKEKAENDAAMEKMKEKIAQYKNKPVRYTDIEVSKEDSNGQN